MATQTKTTQLSDTECLRRQQIIDEARTSTELEGGRSSDEVHALQDRWVRGELTWQEVGAEVRRLHSSSADR
ncbi:antitoxin VbhA family protein [Curtobacterium sp. UCD-KPL2560]|uniref:antitoxin VbhA family protein n=1 Tax=Curtobacterium sp. UCD-KPL2560 TaxID=1885315 RepID=UPI0008266A0A|nr:antitoxin VbhA family protein [Curtobacterium sp. UCD-KPL2560]